MRLFKFALPLLFLAGAALFVQRSFTDAEDRSARGLWQEHARAQFLARAALVRAAPDEQRYQTELRELLRGWFAEQADLGNRWPALRDRPSAFTAPQPRVQGGLMSEFQGLADQVVGDWREGHIELLRSAAASGLRLDLLHVARADAGRPHLAVDVAVWGAPEESVRETGSGGALQTRNAVPLTFRGLSLRLFDAAGRLLATMPGEGEPSLRIDQPDRLVHDAPPSLVLGRFEPGLMPSGAQEVEWTLTALVRTPSGEAREARALFRTPVERSWLEDGDDPPARD